MAKKSPFRARRAPQVDFQAIFSRFRRYGGLVHARQVYFLAAAVAISRNLVIVLGSTSGVSGPDTLWRVRWTPLFGLFSFLLF